LRALIRTATRIANGTKNLVCARALSSVYLSAKAGLNLKKQISALAIDEIIALLGIALALALTILLTLTIGRLVWITVGIVCFFGFLLYLIIRKFTLPHSFLSSLSMEICSNSIYVGLNLLFFILLSYSVLCFGLRPDTYSRPLSYFIATAFMVAIVALEILLLPSSGWYSYFALCKIALIGVSLEFSQLLVFPSIVGIDSWSHQLFTLSILKVGHIPEGFAYSQLPFMHLIVGSTSLVTGLDYKVANMISISLAQVLSDVLFTFLLGKLLFNSKIGLLGGLFLATANWHIWAGYSGLPNTIAGVIALGIIYLLLKMTKEESNLRTSFVILVLMGALILTHTLTAAWMSMILAIFAAAFVVHSLIYKQTLASRKRVTFVIPVLFAIGMFSWWTYVSGHINALGELIKSGFSAGYFIRSMPDKVVRYLYNVPLPEQLFNNLGLFLFFSISLIGCLYMVSKFGGSHSFVMAIGGLATMALAFFPLLFNMQIIMERWLYFSQILLTLPLAIAVCLLFLSMRSKVAGYLLLVALTLSLSFLMILSPAANLDNSAFLPNTQVRYASTESELQAVRTITKIWNGTVGVDSYCSDLPSGQPLSFSICPAQDIGEELYSMNFSGARDMLVMIRKEIVDHPFLLLQAIYRLDYDPRETIVAQGFSRVYDCGTVQGFTYPTDMTHR
jgi:hypothetical protein